VAPDVEEALELVDVVVEDRHQAGGVALLVEREVEVLDVVERRQPQLVLHVLRQVAPEDLRRGTRSGSLDAPRCEGDARRARASARPDR
jgi:hypothetical protein